MIAMKKKLFAAILSNREWVELSSELSSLDIMELLSPLHRVSDLESIAHNGMLDIVFIDIEEHRDLSVNGKVGALAENGIFTVFISDAMRPDDIRNAMRAGAKDFLSAPFKRDDIARALHGALRLKNSLPPAPAMAAPAPVESKKSSEIITFFSTKGGAGKSVLCTNFALALAQRCDATVCMVDLSLQFGDLALILNTRPRATIMDVIDEQGHIAPDIESFLSKCDNSVSLLPAPFKPEQADLIKGHHIEGILEALNGKFDYIVIDTAASFSDISLAALDRSSRIFHVVTPIILSVKNLTGSLELMRDSLEYPQEKQQIILNRCDSQSGIFADDIERIISRKINFQVPSDGNVVVPSLNRGQPAVISAPQSKFSKSVIDMAMTVAGVQAAPQVKKPWYKRLFSK